MAETVIVFTPDLNTVCELEHTAAFELSFDLHFFFFAPHPREGYHARCIPKHDHAA